MVRKSEQVLIRLTPNRMEDWEEAEEERGCSSLSEFVRMAVDNEIEGRNRGIGGGSIDPTEITEAVEEGLSDHTEELTQRLSSIEGAIEGLQDDIGEEGERTVESDLVFEYLPNFDPYTRDDDGNKVPKPEEEVVKVAKTPEEVAGEIGVPTPPVRRTIEQLDLQSERVYSKELDSGQRRYFIHV